MNPNNYDSPTPTTDTNALLMMMVVLGGDVGEVTVAILQGMYPSPQAMTN